jgi:hypothetical protein
MGNDNTLLTLLMHQFPDAVHVTQVDPANKCYFFMKMADASIDFDQRVKQRGGYDTRAVKCDLMELADPKILAKPGAKSVRWKVSPFPNHRLCRASKDGRVCPLRARISYVGLEKQCVIPPWG